MFLVRVKLLLLPLVFPLLLFLFSFLFLLPKEMRKIDTRGQLMCRQLSIIDQTMIYLKLVKDWHVDHGFVDGFEIWKF